MNLADIHVFEMLLLLLFGVELSLLLVLCLFLYFGALVVEWNGGLTSRWFYFEGLRCRVCNSALFCMEQ
jgi:hypothetical protein